MKQAEPPPSRRRERSRPRPHRPSGRGGGGPRTGGSAPGSSRSRPGCAGPARRCRRRSGPPASWKSWHHEHLRPELGEAAGEGLHVLDGQSGRHADADGDPRGAQFCERLPALLQRRGLRLEEPADALRVGRDGDVHADALELANDVDVADDERAARLDGQARLMRRRALRGCRASGRGFAPRAGRDR